MFDLTVSAWFVSHQSTWTRQLSSTKRTRDACGAGASAGGGWQGGGGEAAAAYIGSPSSARSVDHMSGLQSLGEMQ
jgi:hypothetical protein